MDYDVLSYKAIEAALAAGEIIRSFIDIDLIVENKIEPSSYAAQVVTEVDMKCDRVIRDHLLPSCGEFDLAILSEETKDDGGRFEKEYFWCIDPMDGTLPFINKQTGFSVSIALVAKDGTPHIGVVYDPDTEILYHAVKGLGAFRNRKSWVLENNNKFLTYVTDKKLIDTPGADDLKKRLNNYLEKFNLETIKEMSGGGSVMNGIYVLENGPACMMKLPKDKKGGGSIWDFAAIACIYQELGMTATNYSGGMLDLNRKESSFMNHEGVFFGNLFSNEF